jgi:glycosyltransferase involved in cell wall biosynthesis
MKVIVISTELVGAGGFRAANRIYLAMLAIGVNAKTFTSNFDYRDDGCSLTRSSLSKFLQLIRPRISNLIIKIIYKNSKPRSLSILPSGLHKLINRMDVDIVNLHWVNGEFLSIADIGSIKKPVIWTLHDMWAFCGTEHIAVDEEWKSGYLIDVKNALHLSRWIDRGIFKLKQRKWKNLNIVVPSNWLKNCAEESILFRKMKISVIPNTLDLNIWKPKDKSDAREILGLPKNSRLILFSAVNLRDANKGYSLLIEALKKVDLVAEAATLVLLGDGIVEGENLPINIINLGRLADDISLSLVYSAVDVVVVPSRIESFGQVAAEAHACGTPVVCFQTSGLVDIVDHTHTGYLAKPYCTRDLAKGIEWVLSDKTQYKMLCINARQKAEENWSYKVVGKKYETLCDQVLNRKNV